MPRLRRGAFTILNREVCGLAAAGDGLVNASAARSLASRRGRSKPWMPYRPLPATAMSRLSASRSRAVSIRGIGMLIGGRSRMQLL